MQHQQHTKRPLVASRLWAAMFYFSKPMLLNVLAFVFFTLKFYLNYESGSSSKISGASVVWKVKSISYDNGFHAGWHSYNDSKEINDTVVENGHLGVKLIKNINDGVVGWIQRAVGKKRREKIKMNCKRNFVVVFLHIHKAGGTTIADIARANREVKTSGNGNVHPMYWSDGKAWQQRTFVRMSGLSFVANEWMLSDEVYMGSEVAHFVMIRNPMSRDISHFEHAFEMYQNPNTANIYRHCRKVTFYKKFNEKLQNLGKDAKYEDILLIWLQYAPDNFQTRTVCGRSCYEVPFGEVNSTHLEIAKSRLSKFWLVGITERFYESSKLFKLRLGWKYSNPDKHRGGSHNSDFHLNLNASVQAFARQRNNFDIELYNFANQLLDKQLREENIKPLQSLAIPSNTDEELGNFERTRFDRNCTTPCCVNSCSPMGHAYDTAVRYKLSVNPVIPNVQNCLTNYTKRKRSPNWENLVCKKGHAIPCCGFYATESEEDIRSGIESKKPGFETTCLKWKFRHGFLDGSPKFGGRC